MVCVVYDVTSEDTISKVFEVSASWFTHYSHRIQKVHVMDINNYFECISNAKPSVFSDQN